jgi:transcriptional regulator with XRE-family HTH domain
MAQSANLVEVLKRELKARGITYAKVAKHLGLSEASVKRLFSRKDLSLKRIDGICELANMEFSVLAEIMAREESRIAELTLAQEQEIVGNIKLFLVAVLSLNHVSFEEMLETYELGKPELIKLLVRLDRLKFIKLLPNNRIRLQVSPTFAWRPDGPIQRFFKDRAAREYFRARFDDDGELLVLINGILSKPSRAAFVGRLRRLAREFTELASEDVRLPIPGRRSMSLVLAVRHWDMQAFSELRRHHQRRAAE